MKENSNSFLLIQNQTVLLNAPGLTRPKFVGAYLGTSVDTFPILLFVKYLEMNASVQGLTVAIELSGMTA